MDTLMGPKEERKGINKAFLLGGLVGLIALGALVTVLLMQPSREEQMANVLDGSFHEGSPEFNALTKDIVISTEDDTVESPNAFGSISMYISGLIRNRGQKVLNGLEVNVAVVDRFNQVLKEKRILVIPTQRPQLGPNETIPVHLEISGFTKDDDRANIRWKVTAIRTAD